MEGATNSIVLNISKDFHSLLLYSEKERKEKCTQERMGEQEKNENGWKRVVEENSAVGEDSREWKEIKRSMIITLIYNYSDFFKDKVKNLI